MRIPVAALVPALAAALGIAAAAARAADGSVSFAPGDRVSGSLAEGETDRASFLATQGARVSFRLDAAFEPEVVLRDPSGQEVSLDGFERDGADRRWRLRPFPLPASGRWTLEIVADEGGGAWTLATAAANPRRRALDAAGSADEEVAVPLGEVPAGARLRVAVGRGSLAGLDGPAGAEVPPSGRGAATTTTATGPWIARVVPRSGERPARVRVSVRLPRPVPSAREALDDAGSGGEDPRYDGAVLVRLRDGADGDEFDDRNGCETEGSVPGTGFVRVLVPEGVEVEDFLEQVGLDGDVVESEPERVSETPEGGQSNLAFTGSEFGRADVDNQPAFAAVGLAQALALSTGDGVIVAVVDTGVQADHPDLAGKLLPGFDLVDGDALPLDEANGLDDDGDGLVDEGVGHGTFVAGLVLAVAPGARIVPVRVLDSDARGSSSRVAEGIVRAADAGATVINASLGLVNPARVIEDAIDYAKVKGAIVVASSGNRSGTAAVDFPGSLSEVFTVTAVDGAGVRPGFANAGSKVDLAAPGVDLVGTFAGGAYARWSGTSFAAPFVSAGTALVLARSPGMKPRDAARRLEDTAASVDAQNPGLAGSMGAGRVNLPAALQPK